MTVISDILKTIGSEDDLGLLYAISEGFVELRKYEEEDALLSESQNKSNSIQEGGASTTVGEYFCAMPSTFEDKNENSLSPSQQDGSGFAEGPNLQRTYSKHAIYRDRQVTDEELPNEGMFGTARAPTWSLGVYFRSVGSTREKRAIAMTAWTVCALSLLVALVFISHDFVASRNSVSKAVRYQGVPSLQLPDIQICNIDTSFPPFTYLPNKDFVGQPTTWIDTILYPGKGMRVVKYPDTHNSSIATQVKVLALDQYGAECKAQEKADPITFFLEMQNPPACFYCMYIKRSPAIVIESSSGTLIHQDSEAGNSLVLRLSRSRLLEKCRLSFAPPSPNEKRAFRALIERHAEELEKRGTLDFGGLNVSDPRDAEILFPAFRTRVQDYYVRDVTDMYCNVYLFSGFFYPATRGDVQYKFNLFNAGNIGIWQRSGRGPYFPPNYAEWFQVLTMRSNQNNTIGGELKKFYVSRGDMIVAFTNASESGRLQQIASQNPGSLSEIALEQAVIKGKEIYTGHALYTDLKMVDARGVDFVYLLKFGFREFVTKTVSDQMTASTTAYLADVFGLISLFMDVSVYTVIVAPIVMRFRRQSAMAAAAQEAD